MKTFLPWLGAAVMLVSWGGYVYAQDHKVATLEEQTSQIAAATKTLQELHLAANAAERGKKELLLELCRAGKLEDQDCIGVE